MAPTTGIRPATGISAPWATTRYGRASCGPTAPRGRAGAAERRDSWGRQGRPAVSFLDARLGFFRRLEGRLGRFFRRLEGRLGRLRDGPNLHAMLAGPGPETALPALLIQRLLLFPLLFRLLLALPELRVEAQGEVGDASGGDGK